jgi:hypothetical protein
VTDELIRNVAAAVTVSVLCRRSMIRLIALWLRTGTNNVGTQRRSAPRDDWVDAAILDECSVRLSDKGCCAGGSPGITVVAKVRGTARWREGAPPGAS